MATTKPKTPTASKIAIVYDKQCPACNYYCNLLAIRQSLVESGVTLKLVDARQNSAATHAAAHKQAYLGERADDAGVLCT